MKIVTISCSVNAYKLAKKLETEWKRKNRDDEFVHGVKCSGLPDVSMSGSVRDYVERIFDDADAILFFTATGIAVRCIANCIVHKSKDPAILVMDEGGHFCIPLLSGHMGGANLLAREISTMLGSCPVVTTATDVEGKFSVDDFARKYHLQIENYEIAKQISANVLQEKMPALRKNPEAVSKIWELEAALLQEGGLSCRASKSGLPEVQIHYRRIPEHEKNCLCLIPRILVVGIGCKKGTPVIQIQQAIEQVFLEAGLYVSAISKIASIDLKKEEPGILEYCRKRKLPFETYSAGELLEMKGDFHHSEYVKAVTGVSNVCERSAIAASRECQGRLVVKRQVHNKITIAVALDVK